MNPNYLRVDYSACVSNRNTISLSLLIFFRNIVKDDKQIFELFVCLFFPAQSAGLQANASSPRYLSLPSVCAPLPHQKKPTNKASKQTDK